MADGVALAQAFTTEIETLPTNQAGKHIVDNPSELALALVSLAANEYGPEAAQLSADVEAAQTEKALVQSEVTALRSDVDALRTAVANAHAELVSGDSAAALTILTQHVP